MLQRGEKPQDSKNHRLNYGSNHAGTPRLKIDLSRYLKKSLISKRTNSSNPKVAIKTHNPLSEPPQTPKGIIVTVNNTPLSECRCFTSQSVSEDEDEINDMYKNALARSKTHRELL